jgi:hypothetical protein
LVVQVPARPHATEGIKRTASGCVRGHPSPLGEQRDNCWRRSQVK